MVVAAVDESRVWCPEECLQAFLGHKTCGAERLVCANWLKEKGPGLSEEGKVRVQLVEPLHDRDISSERAEANAIERLSESKNFQSFLLA